MQRFSHVPNPYVIEPPPFGARQIEVGGLLQFGLVLMGEAIAQLPLISFALQRAVEKNGLGPQRVRGTLVCIEWQRPERLHEPTSYETIWEHGDTALAAHNPVVTLPQAPFEVRQASLRVSTPMRLQHQGRPVRVEALTPRKLVADLLRRISLQAEFHAAMPGVVEGAADLVRQAEQLTQYHTLRWQDWSRYSSRQQREMTLGGALGTWVLEGDLSQLYPWLWLGQWLHVGKNATLGMGHYTMA